MKAVISSVILYCCIVCIAGCAQTPEVSEGDVQGEPVKEVSVEKPDTQAAVDIKPAAVQESSVVPAAEPQPAEPEVPPQAIQEAPAIPEPVKPEPVPEPLPPPEAPVQELPPEPQPVPTAAKDDVIAEFEGVTITRETYDQTKTEVEQIVDKLNAITAKKDYNQWLYFLSPAYRQEYSNQTVLNVVSDALPVKGIKLKSLKDYFTYVFVPSRQKSRVDDIQFLSPNHVNVIMYMRDQALIIYQIEKIDGNWKLIPPKH